MHKSVNRLRTTDLNILDSSFSVYKLHFNIAITLKVTDIGSFAKYMFVESLLCATIGNISNVWAQPLPSYFVVIQKKHDG